MNLLSRILQKLPKKHLAVAGLVALAIALPASSLAADTVQIEGSIGVANATRAIAAGQNVLTYDHSTNAAYDEVVKVQVYYHNRELPDSGKLANNLTVKINVPNTAGVTQTISETTKADNSNTVNDSASVILDGADAHIEYIPGTAVWRHNTGTNDQLNIVDTPVSDSIVYSGAGVRLEDEKPCYNFAGSVTIQVRVMVPGVTVVKKVAKQAAGSPWAQQMTANPGDTIKYYIYYKNTGNTAQNQVVIRDSLPTHTSLVPNQTYLINATNPKTASNPYGTLITSNNVEGGGIVIGDYAPGADAYVTLFVKLDDAASFACGKTELSNVGVAHPSGMNEFYNTALVDVTKDCTTTTTPKYSCDAFDITKGDNRTITVNNFAQTSTDGATFNMLSINWGDNSSLLQTNTPKGKTHQYAKDGTYTITATAHFTVNGADVTDTNASCTKTVTFSSTPNTPPTTPPSTPTSLPNTGAGAVVTLFAAVAVMSAFAHRLFLGRRITE